MNEETSHPLAGPFYHRLLKPAEVAQHLCISRSFAYHLLQTGTIPTVRLGKACRVRPQDLEAYIQQNLHSQIDER